MCKQRLLLTFDSGEASGWRRLPEKNKSCVSNAKPNAVSKTKLKMLPLNLPRQFHKQAGQGHLESQRKISPTTPIPDWISQILHSCLRAGDVNQTILPLTARNSNERQAWHEKGEGKVTALPAGANTGKSRDAGCSVPVPGSC